jgi:hypothetical protein
MEYESALHCFEEYTGLSYSEYCAIYAYMEVNDPSQLGEQVLKNGTLSLGFSRFIADLLTGKKKRPIKKASTLSRDYAVYQEINKSISGEKTLKEISIVIAGKINRSVDAVYKMYYRGKATEQEYMEQLEVWEEQEKNKSKEDAEQRQAMINYREEEKYWGSIAVKELEIRNK